MSTINLDKKGISIEGPEFETIAPTLQSNILKSHSRDHVRLLFLQFTGNEAKVKEWIKNFISSQKYVVSAEDQKADTEAFKRGEGSKTLVNFYLSAKGYEKLGYNTDKFRDGHIENANEEEQEGDDVEDEEMANPNVMYGNNDFVHGMKSKRVNKKLKDPNPGNWETGYNTDLHAMVLLADDDESKVTAATASEKHSLAAIATIIKEETGENLYGFLPSGKKIPIEHFGYADGISQPRYFTEDVRTSPVDLQPLSLAVVKDPFTDKDDDNYGSFLVYRKLEQDVEGFNNRIAKLAGNLHLTPNQKGKITEKDYAGALAVGRFKDGTPLVQSDLPLGVSPAFNDFKYEQVDRQAHKCPFHAHIRKANPRGQGILVQEKGRFITRRGITYGKQDAEKKGLLFMCFQSNLKRQYNFIQKTWANAPAFPPLRGRPGIDPMIGQGNEGNQSWPVQYGSEHEIEFDVAGFIRMMGGEYFFAPSLGFLKNM